MESKLTLYDILAVVVPGGVLLIVLGALTHLLHIELPIQFNDGVSGTTAFLIFVYFAGHVVQAIGKWYETKILVERWNGFPSIRFLRDSDSHYSTEFKVRVLSAVKEKFEVSVGATGADLKSGDKRRQEIFNLCYSYTTDRDLAKMAYLMNATYGLFRGFVISCSLCSILLLGSAVFLLIRCNSDGAGMCAILGCAFVGASILFSGRLKQRGELFADNVYRSFLTGIQTQKGDTHENHNLQC